MAIRIKICCISSAEEASVAIEYGASALGLVGHMPSGPGVISDELIFSIAHKVPPPIGTFLLTSETAASAIIEHHTKTATNTIQLVDALTEGNFQQIRNALPAIKLVQVIMCWMNALLMKPLKWLSRQMHCYSTAAIPTLR